MQEERPSEREREKNSFRRERCFTRRREYGGARGRERGMDEEEGRSLKRGVGEERDKDVDTVPGIIETKMTYGVLGGSFAKV